MDYTPEQKWQIVREGRSQPRHIKTVCAKYDISRETYYEWERQVEAAAIAALQSEKPGPKPAGYVADQAAREQLEEVERQRQVLEKEVRDLRKEVYLTKLEQDWIKFRFSQLSDKELQNIIDKVKKKDASQQRKKRGS